MDNIETCQDKSQQHKQISYDFWKQRHALL